MTLVPAQTNRNSRGQEGHTRPPNQAEGVSISVDTDTDSHTSNDGLALSLSEPQSISSDQSTSSSPAHLSPSSPSEKSTQMWSPTNRLFTDSFCRSIEAVHAHCCRSDSVSRQVLVTMAFLLHNFARVSHDIELILKEQQSHTSGSSPDSLLAMQVYDNHLKPKRKAESKEGIETVEFDTSDPSTFYRPSPRVNHHYSLAPHLDIDPTGAMLACVIALNQESSFMDSHLTASTKRHCSISTRTGNSYNSLGPFQPKRPAATVNLPPFSCPEGVSEQEHRIYSIMQYWKKTPEIDAIIQEFYGPSLEFQINVHLQAEQMRNSQMPFGVIVYPQYPRPFVPNHPWANQRLARMLGFSHGDLISLCKARKTFYSLYAPECHDTVLCAFHTVMPQGLTNLTFPMYFQHKSGRKVPVIVSMRMRYFRCMPMYAVLYIQECPAQQKLPNSFSRLPVPM